MQTRIDRATRAIIVLAGAALICANQPASAESHEGESAQRGRHDQHCGGGGRGDSMGHFLDHHADELGLDDETRTSIGRIVSESRKHSNELAEARREAEQTLRAMMSSAEIDRAAVMRQVDVLGAIELEQRKHRVATRLDVRAQLTPEQRKQLDAQRKSRQAARHHGKGEGKGKGKGKGKNGHGKRAGHDGETCEQGDFCPHHGRHGDENDED